MAGYSIVLVPPWQRIQLGADVPAQVAAVVDRSVSRLPKEVPPDQVGPLRRRFERQLAGELAAARDAGAVDYFFPAEAMHGNQLNASFTVSAVIPDAMAEAADVDEVMADLLSTAGDAVEVGGSLWVRTEDVFREALDDSVVLGLPGTEIAGRKVDYVTVSPDDHRRWVVVSFSTLGDGAPDSEFTHLVVELFDAMMTTWRWAGREDYRAE